MVMVQQPWPLASLKSSITLIWESILTFRHKLPNTDPNLSTSTCTGKTFTFALVFFKTMNAGFKCLCQCSFEMMAESVTLSLLFKRWGKAFNRRQIVVVILEHIKIGKKGMNKIIPPLSRSHCNMKSLYIWHLKKNQKGFGTQVTL